MERHITFFRNAASDLYFGRMLLSVCKTDGFDSLKLLLGPEQACRRILSTRETNHSGISFFFHRFLVFNTWFSKHTETTTAVSGTKIRTFPHFRRLRSIQYHSRQFLVQLMFYPIHPGELLQEIQSFLTGIRITFYFTEVFLFIRHCIFHHTRGKIFTHRHSVFYVQHLYNV